MLGVVWKVEGFCELVLEIWKGGEGDDGFEVGGLVGRKAGLSERCKEMFMTV